MEITENERLMLIKKKEEIFQLTSEILDTYQTSGNVAEVIKRMNHTISLLTTIEGYSKPDRDFKALSRFVAFATPVMMNGFDMQPLIIAFCSTVNSISFDFTKKGVKISIPINIEAILNKIQFGH